MIDWFHLRVVWLFFMIMTSSGSRMTYFCREHLTWLFALVKLTEFLHELNVQVYVLFLNLQLLPRELRYCFVFLLKLVLELTDLYLLLAWTHRNYRRGSALLLLELLLQDVELLHYQVTLQFDWFLLPQYSLKFGSYYAFSLLQLNYFLCSWLSWSLYLLYLRLSVLCLIFKFLRLFMINCQVVGQ